MPLSKRYARSLCIAGRLSMRETLVLCGDVPPRGGGHGGQILKLDASPTADPRHRVGLELEAISRVLEDNVPDILADMLEVAAYVYAADRLIKRGSPMLTDMGADWRRKIRLRVAVRSPARWEAPDVKAALVEALEFLSEDTWDFEFLQTEKKNGDSALSWVQRSASTGDRP